MEDLVGELTGHLLERERDFRRSHAALDLEQDALAASVCRQVLEKMDEMGLICGVPARLPLSVDLTKAGEVAERIIAEACAESGITPHEAFTLAVERRIVAVVLALGEKE